MLTGPESVVVELSVTLELPAPVVGSVLELPAPVVGSVLVVGVEVLPGVQVQAQFTGNVALFAGASSVCFFTF